jgi:threonylcarbamoyladenosine tRNA methylthiotransferase MtaB
MFHVEGKIFSVVTLGCRTNHYEAEAVASALERRGAVFLPNASAPADIVLIFTCSITSTADAKTRKLLRRARRDNPGAAVVACGCCAQELPLDEAFRLGANILVGNRMKHEIPGLLERWFAAADPAALLEVRDADIEKNRDWDALHLDRPRAYTRAFIKIQDGCSRTCSYCAVPRLRGAESSRPPGEIYEEISKITESGCIEAILTGIHLGGYRHGSVGLAELVGSLSSVPGLARLRLGSLEPFAASDGLLRALASSSAFCPHLHLPVQSGDDEVLARMRRGYDSSGFKRMADRVRSTLGEMIHISTDLIVGFPGETDSAFERSLGLLEDVGFGRVHVFPFSPRGGTSAAKMEGRVDPAVVRERTERAVHMSRGLLSRYAARWVGASDSILVEGESARAASGWTRHYIKAYAASPSENFTGKEFSINPKIEIGGILLGEGVTAADIMDSTDE